MSAFGTPTFLEENFASSIKTAVVSVAGSASYDTGGSAIDLSGATLGNWAGFQEVYSVVQCGVSPAASDKYDAKFIPGTSGAPAAGLLKVRDLTAASCAEVTATTNLSATTFYFEVKGR